MDFIDEILFNNREKVKRLVQEKKKGELLAEKLKVPFDRLQEYKETIKQDLKLCTPDQEVYTNHEEFRFRSGQQIMNPKKFVGSKPILFKDISEKSKVITDRIKKLSKKLKESGAKNIEEKELIPLTASEEIFVQHFIINRNANRAAQAAGYQGSGTATKLLAKPRIQKAIADKVESSLAKAEVTPESVIANIELVRDRAMQGHPVLDQDGVYLGEWKYDANGALKALELQGKYLKMFSDRADGPQVNFNQMIVYQEPEYDLSELTTEELESLRRIRSKIKIVEKKNDKNVVEANYKKV